MSKLLEWTEITRLWPPHMCTCVHICIHPHEYKHAKVSQMIGVVDLILPFGEKLYQYGFNKLDMMAHTCKPHHLGS